MTCAGRNAAMVYPTHECGASYPEGFGEELNGHGEYHLSAEYGGDVDQGDGVQEHCPTPTTVPDQPNLQCQE